MRTLLPESPPVPDRISRGQFVAVGVVALLVFVMSTGRLLPATVGIGIAVMALASAFAIRRTSVAVLGGMIAIALIPVYWGPYIPHTHEAVLPVLLVCLVLLPRAWSELAEFRITSVDWMMAAYVAMRILGSLVNSSRGAGGALDAVLYAAMPYGVFRLLGLHSSLRRAAAVGIVAAGAICSIFTIREYSGVPNPFFKHFRNGYQHAYWVRVDTRFHRIRPEASFGHADALGLFLAFATIFAVSLAWHEHKILKRCLLYGCVALCLQGIADTLERGPIILLLLAFPIILAVELRHGRSMRVLVAVAAAALVFAATPFGATALRLKSGSEDQTNKNGLQASAQDRYDTIRAMADPRYFTLLGHNQGDDPSLSVAQAIGLSTRLGAIENAFMWTYVVYGALACAAFAAMTVPMTKAALSKRLDLLDRSWAAIVVSTFVIFLSVGLASQFAHFFWIALGITAAAVQQSRAEAAPAPQRDALAMQLRG